MNRKAFVVAIIFLVVALVAPPILIHNQYDADLINLLNQSSTNASQIPEYLIIINQENLMLFAIIGVVETVSVILFVVFLWIALTSYISDQK